MKPVTLSPRYQVVIPRAICREIGLEPGVKFQVVRSGSGIELIPLRLPPKIRVYSRGLDKTIDRE